jgi:hypothetical protein
MNLKTKWIRANPKGLVAKSLNNHGQCGIRMPKRYSAARDLLQRSNRLMKWRPRV